MKEKYWNEIETISNEIMMKIQYERLSKTIKKVYETVPFYKEKFIDLGIEPYDIKSVSDLYKLPFTTKQDLRDNYPYGLYAEKLKDIVRIHASSGTTGKQTIVGYTKADIEMWTELVARALTAANVDYNDSIHISYGYGLFTGGLGLHGGAEAIGATTIPVSAGNTKRQIQIMKDLGSTVLCCTPSYGILLGETIQEMGLDPKVLKLKAGLFGAEPWTRAMQLKLEELLDIKAFDIYGLSEIIGPGVSFSCSENNGLHVNEDHFIAEIINPKTCEVLPYGEEGELVFTCITKEALPLIRYRTGDISSLKKEKCSCGRTLIKMNKPCGRIDDMLIIRGVNVFPSQIESVLLEICDTTPHYQIIVDRKGSLDNITVQVEMNDIRDFDNKDCVQKRENEIRRSICSVLGIDINLDLVPPKSIERSNGKIQRVKDKRKEVLYNGGMV